MSDLASIRIRFWRSAVFCCLLTFFAAANAAAQLVYTDAMGNPVTAPAVLDPMNEAVYFTDTDDGVTGGVYDVTNNTVDYGLLAFGISNVGTTAYLETIGNTFACDGNGSSFWCYEALNLDAVNFTTEDLDFEGNTPADVFGTLASVTDPGEDTVNFYRGADGDLQPGDFWDGFLYDGGMPQGQLFVVLSGRGGTIYGTGGVAVPEPGLAGGLVAGLGGLSLLGRRRR